MRMRGSSSIGSFIETLKEDSWTTQDHAVLENIITPRVVLCSVSDLVERVFEVVPSQFRVMSHRARKSGGKPRRGRHQDAQGSLQYRFQQEQQPANVSDPMRTASWVEGVARHARSYDARPREYRLSVATAQRPCRRGVRTELKPHYGMDSTASAGQQEVTRFLTCKAHLHPLGKVPLSWEHALGVFAFGLSARYWGNPGDAWAPELVKVVLDLEAHLLAQPTRQFAPGIAINKKHAYLVVLDHETCRVAPISHCWGRGFGQLAAVLSVLLDLDVYTAGFFPFSRYRCYGNTDKIRSPISFPTTGALFPTLLHATGSRVPQCEAASGLAAVSLLTAVFGSPFGRTVEFKEEPIELVSCATTNGDSVFAQCTTVFHLTRPSLQQNGDDSSSFVLKMKYVNPSSVNTEVNVLREINEALEEGRLPSTVAKHLAVLEHSASPPPPRSQVDDECMPAEPLPKVYCRAWPPYPEVSRRSIELLILRNPTPMPTPMWAVTPTSVSTTRTASFRQILQVFDQLLSVLLALFDHNFHHRDICIRHILHREGHLVLVDWSAGIVAPLGDAVLMGAMDSVIMRGAPRYAPIDVLWWNIRPDFDAPRRYELGHPLESWIYCFLDILSCHISPGDKIWDLLAFETPAVRDMADRWGRRVRLWKQGLMLTFLGWRDRLWR
ncbi:BZ3500_MvSof-1268-A1-R1_Chr6-2g08486 [Microbotryum saponariae]|uniref:BZ3500_MvSof-1268-A1-R1_Chr6-2g08486 protein n=1 Tax=Microbotryum saponariae TaxID=289078 RepID=A0A2X0M6R5_9BASI|nr:BZ3500_MvSof-1268-A1-R1_Chr6-2g08486 [Microbotryum saponariae]SDA07763.1 BZ3501_MvSof-1269-A2-R1_Chr6-1g08200 [Microbotryum saponariae]